MVVVRLTPDATDGVSGFSRTIGSVRLQPD